LKPDEQADIGGTATGSQSIPQRPRIAFFRITNFLRPIGDSDWRIGLYMPQFGFDVWIYGQGSVAPPRGSDAILVSILFPRIPILGSIVLCVRYALDALSKKIDLVVCNPGVFWAGVLYKIISPSAKLIVDIRSVPVETHPILEFIMWCSFDLIFMSRCYDAVSVITEGMRDELDKRYGFMARCPSVVWESGYDDAIFKPSTSLSIKPDTAGDLPRFTLMFHGSLSPNRGLFETIRAVRLLKDRGMMDIGLVLIGEGLAVHALEDLARDLDVMGMIDFHSFIPHENLPAVLARADIGLDLLPNHPWWRNQSALKVQEYLAMGKPVLATDLPCHKNISDAVIIIPNNDPSTIAGAIEDYRNLPKSEHLRLSDVALRDSRTRTWRAKAEALSKFIEEQVL
jgi:glycosyltransferase involved in cell wall biosynthesis